jgi:alanyl-tRNA synthetase
MESFHLSSRGTPMKSDEIRNSFVKYYESMGYEVLPSTPMIDPSIPMSFVMSAGLVQVESSLQELGKTYRNRFVLVQKCFRHFDLDRVGSDDIHLSLFEMPGAFVFGPIDKSESIQNMWELAIEILDINKSRVWASYFGGDRVAGEDLEPDDTTRGIWLNLGLHLDHVVGLGAEHNYWIQGKGLDIPGIERKCGVNTELFFERENRVACGECCRPGCTCGRFIEFSNSLFITSTIDPITSRLEQLPEPFTETVIGTERVALIKQKASSIFGTTEYRSIVELIRGFISTRDLPSTFVEKCVCVMADHLKALYTLIDNGAPPPGKDGRQRIIKILIRKIIARQIVLGIATDDLLKTILPSIAGASSHSSNDHTTQKVVEAYYNVQVEKFSKTIERGRNHLMRLLEENNGKTLTGPQILRLEKQWGLPALLTQTILWKEGLNFPETDYLKSLHLVQQPNNRTQIRGGL